MINNCFQLVSKDDLSDTKIVENLKQLKIKELPEIEFIRFKDIKTKKWNVIEQKFGLKIIETNTLSEAKKTIISNTDKILEGLEMYKKRPFKNMHKILIVNLDKTSNSKLLKPLFVYGNYNKTGKRMRVKPVKTIGEYSIVISSGKPDKNNAKNDRDQYYLFIEYDGWAVPTGLTEYELEQKTGHEQLLKEWYGNINGRVKYLQDNFYFGRTYEEYNPLITQHIAEEEAFIDQAGKNEIYQYEYLKNSIDKHINTYINSRDNDGEFADFIGALFIGELDLCENISMELKNKKEQERLKKYKQIKEQEEKEEIKRKKVKQLLIAETENILIDGGIIKNVDIIIEIAKKYNINIPLRTKGWILNNLIELEITKYNTVNYKYYKKTKNSKGSKKIFDIINEIKIAIKHQKNE